MSYITFAPKFKFQIRFRLREDYPYEDEFYTLISDGPCEGSQPQYSVSESSKAGNPLIYKAEERERIGPAFVWRSM